MASPQTPHVSVVLSALNEERFIGRTIESILSQDYPSVDVHVQDGGSTDGTLSVVRRYPVRCISERDGGVPDAFNRGFRATRGELIIFLGADDPLLPGALAVLSRVLVERPDVGFAYGDIDYVDAADRPFVRLKGRPFDLDDLFWGNHVPTQSVMMRRSALAAVGLYRTGIINADWDLWIRLGARYPSVYVPRLLAWYRVHDRSTTLKNPAKFAHSLRFVADTLLADQAITSRLRYGSDRARAGTYLMATCLSVMAGDSATAKQLFLKAVKGYPQALVTRQGAGALGALLLGPRLYSRVRDRGRGRG